VIFPHGCLPSIEAIARNVARRGDLRIVDLEDITAHYPETLRRWRAKYRDVGLAEAKRLKALEDENRRLKKLVADLSLDNQLLKDVVGRKW
jgi:cyclopropane fatty-acyl-phospholipid synthase-like methyltransferase